MRCSVYNLESRAAFWGIFCGRARGARRIATKAEHGGQKEPNPRKGIETGALGIPQTPDGEGWDVVVESMKPGRIDGGLLLVIR